MLPLMFPAVLQAPGPAAKVADRFAEALEAIPEALTDRRPDRVPAAKAQALALWDREQASLLAVLPEADRADFQAAMAMLRPRSGEAAGLAALEAMALLEHRLPEGRPRWLATADREGMRAWISVDLGRWEALPDLDAAFAWLLAHDGGRHAKAVAAAKRELAAFDAAGKARQGAPALRAAQRLLDLVDVLERP